jgi:hypothetical protein
MICLLTFGFRIVNVLEFTACNSNFCIVRNTLYARYHTDHVADVLLALGWPWRICYVSAFNALPADLWVGPCDLTLCRHVDPLLKFHHFLPKVTMGGQSPPPSFYPIQIKKGSKNRLQVSC